jgi:AcrR family transcriptional regulator
MNNKDLRKERKKHRRQENRDDILEAAEKVFANKGYSSATVDDIAEEAQFSKATIYRYFQSKSDIFMEVIYSAVEESYKEIENKKKAILNYKLTK